MRRYAAELFDAGNIKYKLEMDESIGERKIMMEQRRDLFLIFKETLNNIHKHASASFVSISLSITRDNLVLVVRDDGKGFDTTKQTHRNGLHNIKDRVRRWKGIVDIQSIVGRGTSIEIKVPFSTIPQKGD